MTLFWALNDNVFNGRTDLKRNKIYSKRKKKKEDDS